MLDKQARFIILKALARAYPDGLTVPYLDSILAMWGIYSTSKHTKQVAKPLIEKGFVEVHDVELPALEERVQKLVITEKGMQIVKGELIDKDVERV